ncbi:unannotated protein [freshwater metagenome]|uniref:Unannotated protein n=1 Tax=freshwater metagenome TaxID=449393 RepID=A0A6J6TVS7_9ZZZZ|nr:hypothetical protein [Actinomycetota bacterium]
MLRVKKSILSGSSRAQKYLLTPALIFSLLGIFSTNSSFISPASAADTVTKTITVTGSNSSPSVGALVSIGYEDPNTTNGYGIGWTWTTPRATDANGRIVISGLPKGVGDGFYSELYIQPALGSTDAIYYASPNYQNFNLANSESLEITLNPATFFATLEDSDGNPLPALAGVGHIQTQNDFVWTNTLRPGKVGLYVAPTVGNGENWQFSIWNFKPDNVNNPEAMTQFNMSISSTSGNAPKTVSFKNLFTGDAIPENGDGSYHFRLMKTSFKYEIVDPVERKPTQAYLSVCPDLDNLNDCRGLTGKNGRVGLPVGEWKIRVMTQAAGNTFAAQDYTAVVTESGTATQFFYGYPKTSTAAIFDIPSQQWKLNLALPNFIGNIKGPNGPITLTNQNQGQGFIINRMKKVGDNFQYLQDGRWSGDSFGISFTETGTYLLEVTPRGVPGFTKTRSKEIVVTQTVGGAFNVSYDGGAAAASVTEEIVLLVPNLRMIIKNPVDNSLLNYGWVGIQSVGEFGNDSWVGNADIDPSAPGLTSAQLSPGTYRLRVNPPGGSVSIPGLALRIYTAVIRDTEPKISIYKGTDTSTPVLANSDGDYVLSVGKANVTGKFVDANDIGVGSGSNNKWVNVCLQSLMANGVDWNYLNCSNTAGDGSFSITVTDPGTYRVLFEPQGRTDVTTTTTESFVVPDPVGEFTKAFGNVKSKAPTIKVKVREAVGTTDLQNAGIEIRKNDQFLYWANTGPSAVTAISLPSAGDYKFIVHRPNNGTASLATNKTYSVTAISTDGNISVSKINGETLTVDASGITTLRLGTATLSGYVYAPGDTSTALPNSFVVATDVLTGQQLWQNGANTDQNGFWAMSLPAGSYTILAQTPWGSAAYGNSNPIGDVAVNEAGEVTLSGAAEALSTSAFNINLKNPRWSGTVKDPTGTTGMSNTRVCLNSVTAAGVQSWTCSQTNLNGQWSMSEPAGFNDFDEASSISELQIAENQNPRYSMSVFRGKTAIEATGFVKLGAENIALTLAAPNLSITVTANGEGVPNMWVNLSDPVTGMWLGASGTSSSGVAGFSVDLAGPIKDNGFRVQVNTQNNSEISASYASTTKTFANDVVTGDSVTVTVPLATPNIRGILTDPVTSSPVPNSWIELFDFTNGMWLGGSNTDSNGYFSMNAPGNTSGPTKYNVTANPGYNSTSNASRNVYEAEVNEAGTVTSFINSRTLVAPTTTTYLSAPAYQISLSPASVTGVVKDPSGNAVINNWVVPFDATNNWQLWQNGSNTKTGGRFSMALPDGDYRVQANAPWGSSTYAASAMCPITISANALATPTNTTSCIKGTAGNHTLELTLRGPNLTMTVNKPNGDPLPFANVGVALGNWNTWAQTDSLGRASLFVDPAQILLLNKNFTAAMYSLYLWIDPQYGTSDVVRLSCSSLQANTQCESLNQVDLTDLLAPAEYTTPATTFTLQAPNTRVTVKIPDGSATARAGSWVNLYKTNGGWQWLGASGTNSSGVASFNLEVDTATTVFSVQIDAPWDQKSIYSGATYENLTWDEVISIVGFRLKSPNLKLTVKNNAGTKPANTSWVSAEVLNSDNNPIKWLGGTGLDRNGSASFTLPDTINGEKIKITAHPGSEIGVDTVCILTVDANVATADPVLCPGSVDTATALTFDLALGNIRGLVTAVIDSATVGVAGAIVYANQIVAGVKSTDAATEKITSTGPDGRYDLDLDPAFDWYIIISAINTPSDVENGTELDSAIIELVEPELVGQKNYPATLNKITS